MRIDSRCLSRFSSGKIGKAIGEKTIGLMLEKINDANGETGEVTLGFMKPEELDAPEDDAAEIIVKVLIKRIEE